MLEKKLQTKVNNYLKNRWKKTSAFELKITNGKSLPFDAVKPHQIHALRVAKHAILAYKIPDTGWEPKPFDCFTLAGVEAYVGIMFYTKGCNHFYLIDVDVFVNESETSTRRSLTEERATEIGEKQVMV